MPLVKICGVKNITDAKFAQEAGADALGFNFANSPRHVSSEQAHSIIAELPEDIVKVGLFVNSSLEDILSCVEVSGINAIQLHGDESPEFVAQLKDALPSLAGVDSGWPRLVKAFRLRNEADLTQLEHYQAVDAFLVDAYVEGVPGGTGQKADWELAKQAGEYNRLLLLAGGLNPENVIEAIAQVQPFGVDVSSGVEIAPGVKNYAKISDFINDAKKE